MNQPHDVISSLDLEKELRDSALMQTLWRLRGVDKQGELFSSEQLLPPFSLKGIEQAVAELEEAIVQQYQVIIVGDYDVDGATSTALAIRALKSMGLKKIDYCIPNRFTHGYGLSPDIVDLALEFSPELIVTVDNGINSIEGVEYAKQHGIKVIVTDHHLAGDVLPEAHAIVNPNQPGCDFPSKNLAGVGVMFYVLIALRASLRNMGWFEQQSLLEPNLAQWLDLVALGTVADLVRLDENNRLLVRLGLKLIRTGRGNKGIQALYHTAGKQGKHLMGCSDLGFVIGPRLNAAGRLEDMSIGVKCLLEDDPSRAMYMAMDLNKINRKRRELQQQMIDEAMEIMSDIQSIGQGDSSICLFDMGWHQGIVGLVASKLKEKYCCPVIVFATEQHQQEVVELGRGKHTLLKGSGRSVEGFHLRDALALVDARQPGLIKQFGGHAMAAGLSIEMHKLTKFQNAFAEVCAELLSINDSQQQVDMELNIKDITLHHARLLRLSVWGQQFPEPLFSGQFYVITHRVVGEKHLSLTLAAKKSGVQSFRAILFNATPDLLLSKVGWVEITYKLDVNYFREQEELQLMIEQVLLWE